MKAMTAVVVAALVLASLAGVAGAERGISVPANTNTTLTLPGLEVEGGLGTPVRCNVTLDLAIHQRIGKTTEALVGQSDVAVSTGACTEGNAGLLIGGRRVTGAQGPYHLTYQSFTGELPSISSVTVRINNVVFWIDVGGIDCLTNGAVDIDGTTTGGNPVTGVSVSSQSVPLTGDFLCIFTSGELNGRGSLSSSVRMTLF